MKKKSILVGLALGVIISSVSFLGPQYTEASAKYGTVINIYGNHSYSYAWTGEYGKTFKVLMTVFDMKAEKIQNGWAQTETISISRLTNQYAKSNHWTNGIYVGYSQD